MFKSVTIISKIEIKATAQTVTTFSHMHSIFKIFTYHYLFKVGVKGGNTHIVKLKERSYTSRKWATHHMLCSHVVAGCLRNNIE